MRWFAIALIGSCVFVGAAQHENDLLFGAQAGRATVVQPVPHPVRQMSSVLGRYILDVGLDFYFDPSTGLAQLQSCRVQQVWKTPGIQATRSGIGTVFCDSGCPNYFDLPTLGTPHHHLLFAANTPGVYVWDVRAINARARDGSPLGDMEWVYRVYMVAGSPQRLYGAVNINSAYQGNPYRRMLTVTIRQNGSTLAQQSLPPNPDAIYDYMVGFAQSGTFDIVAKLEGHLSRKIAGFTLSGAHEINWEFTTTGDVNNDDLIDDADLLAVLFAFGQAGETPADVNGDGIVDDADLLVVLFNFGATGEGYQP